MFVVVVEFELQPGQAAAFRERVARQAADSLEREPGCHVFDVCVDPARDDRVLLYEVYTDRAAFDAHLQSAHFAAFDREVADWVANRLVRTFARVDAPVRRRAID